MFGMMYLCYLVLGETNTVGYQRGLKIPAHIKKQLRLTVVRLLENDGHGLSFPGGDLVQMRYIKDGVNMGGSYPLSRYSDWNSLFLRAIADNEKLRRTLPNSSSAPSPDKGVRFVTRYRKGRNLAEYYYAVSCHNAAGKQTIKNFYCGNENTMDHIRKKHTELTAWHFRRLYCDTLSHEAISKENTKDWAKYKYYDNMKPVVR